MYLHLHVNLHTYVLTFITQSCIYNKIDFLTIILIHLYHLRLLTRYYHYKIQRSETLY